MQLFLALLIWQCQACTPLSMRMDLANKHEAPWGCGNPGKGTAYLLSQEGRRLWLRSPPVPLQRLQVLDLCLHHQLADLSNACPDTFAGITAHSHEAQHSPLRTASLRLMHCEMHVPRFPRQLVLGMLMLTIQLTCSSFVC